MNRPIRDLRANEGRRCRGVVENVCQDRRGVSEKGSVLFACSLELGATLCSRRGSKMKTTGSCAKYGILDAKPRAVSEDKDAIYPG